MAQATKFYPGIGFLNKDNEMETSIHYDGRWMPMSEYLQYPEIIRQEKKKLRHYEQQKAIKKLWSVIHNSIAHPLLVTGSKWADRFHDWTADKM